MAATLKLFEKTDERLNLFLPLVLFPLVVAAITFQWGASSGEKLLVNTIASIFLISTLHLGFTFANLIAFPEFQKMIHIKTKGRPFLWWLKWAFIYAGLVFVGLIPYQLITISPLVDYNFMAKFYFGIYLFSSRAHTLMQTQGLLKVYNFKIKNRVDSKILTNQFDKTEAREMLAIFLLVLLCGAQAFVLSFYPNSLGLGYKMTMLALGILIVGFIFFNTLKQKGVEHSSKRSYLLRLLYYPVTPAIGYATIATEIIHGIEYLFVTKEMHSNSSIKNNKLWISMLILFCSAISLVWFLSSHQPLIKYLYRNDLGQIPKVWVVFSVLNVSNALMHFYLDAVIFRFREPEISENIGPLISNLKPKLAANV